LSTFPLLLASILPPFLPSVLPSAFFGAKIFLISGRLSSLMRKPLLRGRAAGTEHVVLLQPAVKRTSTQPEHPRSSREPGQRQLADFVKEQRAAICQLKQARFALGRPGKCAPHVPEQLALEQRLDNR
jgi:hypothetical protein